MRGPGFELRRDFEDEAKAKMDSRKASTNGSYERLGFPKQLQIGLMGGFLDTLVCL